MLETIFGFRAASNEIAGAAAERAHADRGRVPRCMPAPGAMRQDGMQQGMPDREIGDYPQHGTATGGTGGGLSAMVTGFPGGAKAPAAVGNRRASRAGSTGVSTPSPAPPEKDAKLM